MKSVFFAAAAAAFCSTASAWPLLFWTSQSQAPPAAGTQFYQLQTKSSVASVSNQWVTLASGASSYSLASAQSAATKFFVNKYNATQTYALHNSDDTRELALRGANSVLLYLVDATSPRSDTIPSGQLMEWATFTIDNSVLGVKDGSTLTGRTFVVAGTQLALYDGASNTTQAVTPITLNIVRASA